MSDNVQKLFEAANTGERSSISSANREFIDSTQAARAFDYYKTAFSDLGLWNKSSVINSYTLFDENGREVDDKPLGENLFLRISMPGTGKYDWVKIVEIIDSTDEYVLTVKPTYDPTDRNADKARTSHFFAAESSNNFCLLRHGCDVKLYVIGLEEKQNTSETKNALETVRNAVTANVGSYLGIQKGEWTSFCKNFLDSYKLPDKN